MTRPGVLAVLLLGLLTACGPAAPTGPDAEATHEGESSPDVSISLSGPEGLAAVVGPTSLDFGQVRVATSVIMEVFVANTGSTVVQVSSMTISGSSTFSLFAPTGPFTIAPGAQQRLSVRFIPMVEGLIMGTLTLKTNDATNPTLAIALSGSGVRPALIVEPAVINFGEQRVGTSSTQRVRILNVGSAPIAVTSVSLSETSAFVLTSPTQPFMLTPGMQLELDVGFRPTSGDRFTGTLRLTTNDPDYATITVALTGIGVRPQLIVNSSMLDFGEQPVGTTKVMTVRLTNVGTAPVSLTSVTLPSGPFFLSHPSPMPFVLAPGGFQDLAVGFTPTQAGPVNGTLAITSADAEVGSVTIPLVGAGGATESGLVLDVSALDFGTRQVGTSTTFVVTAANAGFNPLFITSLSLTANAYPSFSSTALPAIPFYLAPGSRSQFLVTFNPILAGTFTGTLSLTTHDPLAASTTLALSGQGVNTSLGGDQVRASP